MPDNAKHYLCRELLALYCGALGEELDDEGTAYRALDAVTQQRVESMAEVERALRAGMEFIIGSG
eukprot:2929986-Lingulodinium_polyedra.AAC.1